MSEQNEQGKTGIDLGNTKSAKSNIVQSKYWCFTFNNYTVDEFLNIEQSFRVDKIRYIIGQEIGESGTPHLQGYIESPEKIRPQQLKLSKKIHWEKIKGSRLQNIVYCAKGGKYKISGLVVNHMLICITELKKWQQDILDIYVLPPDGRTCHWIYDPIGGKGKSALCKYLMVHHKVIVIQGGSLGNIMNMVYNSNMNNVNMVCIDIPRNKARVSYSAIECILNGAITNTKYETGVSFFNPPHVIVFSNHLPEKDKLSSDRWHIIHI